MPSRQDSPPTKVSASDDPWRRLSDGADALGTPLNAGQIALFQRFTELLLEANARFNLTAIRNTQEIISKLYLDSLSLLGPVAKAENCAIDELRKKLWFIADIGAGAGIPGVPVHIAWPNSRLLLVESSQKKSTFLTSVILALKLNAEVVSKRAEEAAREESYRERCDLVVARAVAALPTLVEYVLPFVRLGGLAALPKGPRVWEELERAGRAIDLLGGEVIDVAKVRTPGVEGERFVALLRKRRPTPSQYPRRAGLPRKRPLQTL